jgi:hypothetical protein
MLHILHGTINYWTKEANFTLTKWRHIFYRHFTRLRFTLQKFILFAIWHGNIFSTDKKLEAYNGLFLLCLHLFLGPFMWDLQCTNWLWDMFFSNCFSSTLTDAVQPMFHIPLSSRVGFIVPETQHINVSCTVFIDLNNDSDITWSIIWTFNWICIM